MPNIIIRSVVFFSEKSRIAIVRCKGNSLFVLYKYVMQLAYSSQANARLSEIAVRCTHTTCISYRVLLIAKVRARIT